MCVCFWDYNEKGIENDKIEIYVRNTVMHVRFVEHANAIYSIAVVVVVVIFFSLVRLAALNGECTGVLISKID